MCWVLAIPHIATEFTPNPEALESMVVAMFCSTPNSPISSFPLPNCSKSTSKPIEDIEDSDSRGRAELRRSTGIRAWGTAVELRSLGSGGFEFGVVFGVRIQDLGFGVSGPRVARKAL